MPAPRPALIFDFGNVVAHFDYVRACERLAPSLGLTGQAFLQAARDRGLTPILHRYERGELTSREFSSNVLALMELGHSHEEFAAAWADIFTLNESVAALVRQLKRAGYTLVLGSNTNEIHAGHFRRQFEDVLGCFDKLVLSHEVRHMKPSADFYLGCTRAANNSAADCVFIDDIPENVEGARAAGLVGLLYRDTPSLVEELRGLGVMVPPR